MGWILRQPRELLFALGAAVSVAVIGPLGIFLDNPGAADLSDLAPSMAVLISVALTVPVFFYRLGSLGERIALAFPIMLFAFFKFLGFYGAAIFLGLKDSVAVSAAVIGLLFVCAASTAPFRRVNRERIILFVFVVSGAAAAASMTFSLYEIIKRKPIGLMVAEELTKVIATPTAAADDDLPDIIYIVPDRYASSTVLREAFGFDSEVFLNALEQRGFHYVKNARANYAKTVESLASTLNMTDLEPLFQVMPADSTDRGPLHVMIEDNAVQRVLRSIGYQYVHLGNWWEPTRINKNAHKNYYGQRGFSNLSEFDRTLLATTPLPWVERHFGKGQTKECRRLRSQLDYLEEIRARAEDGPIFVFAHLTIPHDPITMDAEGNCIKPVSYPGSGISWGEFKGNYVAYVEQFNRRILEIFDANRSVDRGRSMIFVIQSDEGPYPRRLREQPFMNMHGFGLDEMRMKFGILNAIYWDSSRYGRPYLTQTPINNWRIIFSKIASLEIPLVTDQRSVVFRNDHYVYDVKDVTEVLADPESNVSALLKAETHPAEALTPR
ncbi:hypothetical protein FHS62_002707 [Amphiplicatus metriothermophilus]|nr:hypothetical protein [Amphiplicatus metriothermophilus]